jgi:hypothetical protein
MRRRRGEPLSRWLLRMSAYFVTRIRSYASAMEISRSVDQLPSGSDEV